MTSLKQKAANRRNGLRSKGPVTEAGRIRSSINARKHGLTASIEATAWGAGIDAVETLLADEGLSPAECHELARRIVQFERNLAYRRERFEEIAKPVKEVVPDKAVEDLALAAMISDVRSRGQEKFHRLNKPLARDLQKFFEQTAARLIRMATRDAVQELKNSDRYLRRASNQLIKQLKGLGCD